MLIADDFNKDFYFDMDSTERSTNSKRCINCDDSYPTKKVHLETEVLQDERPNRINETDDSFSEKKVNLETEVLPEERPIQNDETDDESYLKKNVHLETEILPTQNGETYGLHSRTKSPLETEILQEDQSNQSNETEEDNSDFVDCIKDAKNLKEPTFNGVALSNLSKRQMKKYKRMLQWQARKAEKRAKEREKMKKKKIEAKMNNISLGPSRKELKRKTMASSSCKTTVVIDLSFDDLMISKDLSKTIKQVLRVYTENRRAKNPMQLHVTNFDGKSKEEMARHNGYENWDIHFHKESYLEIFPKEKLIYLTSESNNVIKDIEEDKVYIIGGLVDHNAHKGLCHKKAIEEGIAHGQLPISDYFSIKHRKVFTINQVFEILLRVTEGRSFKDAFEMVLPRRIHMEPTDTASKEMDDS